MSLAGHLAIFDTGVLVALAQRDAFATLVRVVADRVVTDVVDGEIASGQTKHPDHFARYDSARTEGLLRVEALVPGSAAYAEYLRLRATRVNPLRNRGEDSCIALALTRPESVVFLDDHGATRRAHAELGDPGRVRCSADI